MNIKTISLGPLGDCAVKPPQHFASCYDVTLQWNDANDAQKARLSGAAIGLCWDDPKKARLPRYDHSTADALAYGGVILHALSDLGVPVSDIWIAGQLLVTEIDGAMPTNAEIDAAVDFIEQKEATSIG